MSEKSSEGEPQVADDDSGGEGSQVESWLRKAARVPDGDPRMPLPQPGQIIGGKYRIEEQLGRGGMGAVYRATHVVSEKHVALKWMLRPASDERALERFTREARAAGRINHPNVVDVYDIGQDGDAGYLVMELLHGESLRSRLARGPLAPSAAVDLLLPAMRGVAAAHREGVIHRDLKPDNIFLCRAPNGSEREAKVLDFGISTISTPDADAKTTLTKEGTVLGTPAYMSPEQLESVRSADARTDVYAFGVILYEALTGRLPFAGDSYSALVLAIANSAARAPRELRPEIPLPLERVVLHSIEKDRAQRFQQVDELIAALQPFGSARSAGSGEHASLERQRATLPQAPRRVGSAAGAIALLVVLLAALSWWLLRERSAGGAGIRATMPRAASSAPAPASSAPLPTGTLTATPNAAATAAPPEQPAAEPPPALRAAGAQRAGRAERSERPASARPTAARAAPSPSAPPPATNKAPARSGTISLDDL